MKKGIAHKIRYPRSTSFYKAKKTVRISSYGFSSKLIESRFSNLLYQSPMFYSSSLRFLAKRSPPVAAASSARPSEALDCSVPVFGNSFAPAFLAGA